jgi:hypothetical protein
MHDRPTRRRCAGIARCACRGYGTALAEILAQLAPELGSQDPRASIEPRR